MTLWDTSSRWRALEPLLDAALDLPSAERAAFVALATTNDPALGAELANLLRDSDRLTELRLLDQSAGGTFSSLLRADPETVAQALGDALAGRYEIVSKLGAGGMATVYLAQDLRHHRQVALKVLHPDLSHTVGAERFGREVRLMSTLEHPNIVGAFDSGEADGHLWFTMPFIQGESLRQRIARSGQLPLDEAFAIFRQAADALAFAHGRGVIHRDIKPDNIMLSGDRAFVADFGIARALEAPGQTLTATGMSVGTPAYMAPEQAAGEKQLDERVDIYALGSVLYEMLAGATAFTGPSAQAIIVRAMTSDPQPIHPIRRAVTPALDAVILKAMSRTTTDRYASMAEFAAAVDVAAVSLETSAPARSTTRPLVRLGIGVVAVAVLAAAGALIWSAVAPGTPRLAVLPFENRSPDSSDVYLADGLTEELGTHIGRVKRVAVLSSSAVRRVGDAAKMSTAELGRILDARYLLTGSVQRINGRLRVSVEVIQASDGERLWGSSYDRAGSELPLLVRDIGVATATSILGTLDPEDLAGLAAPTENSAAYDHYLRGSLTRFAESSAGLQQSVAAFEAALALDPRFAAAQARLAGVYARSLFWSVTLPGISSDSIVARAARASDRALALDSASADAWAGRGTVLFFGPRPDYTNAVLAMGRAAALDSGNAGVHFIRGQVLRRLGDFAGAEASSRAALNADPRFGQAMNQLASLAYTTRQLERARALSDSAITLEPAEWQYWALHARISIALRDTARAIASAERALTASPPDQQFYAGLVLAQAEALRGDTAAARARLAPALATVPPRGALGPRHYQVAAALIATGRPADALAIIERIEPRGAWLWSYLVMPSFDPVRTDPRFVRVVEQARPPGATLR